MLSYRSNSGFIHRIGGEIMRSVESFRSGINSGVQQIGGAVTLNDVMAAELVARNMDFIWIDMEHGSLAIDKVEGQILLAKKNRKTALVRVPELDMGFIKMALDAGAHGVIIPQIYTPDEVRLAVEYTRYYPKGKRGFGPRLSNAYGQMGSSKDYIEWANGNIYLAVQLETKEAYENLDRILGIDGYDAICIGPADLSLSLGYYADIACPEMRDILAKAIGKIKGAGKHVGFGMGVNPDFAKFVLGLGVDWLQIGSDFDYIEQMSKRLALELKRGVVG